MSGLTAVGHFLFSVFFSLLTFVLWLRIAIHYFRISPLHPVSQSIYALTSIIMQPFGALLRTSKKQPSRYDWSAIITLIIVETIKFLSLGWLMTHTLLPLLTLIVCVVTDLILQPCNLLFYAIVIRVIMSWVGPVTRHPFMDIIFSITEPLLRFCSRFTPRIAGLDFAPLVAIIVLQVITLLMSSAITY